MAIADAEERRGGSALATEDLLVLVRAWLTVGEGMPTLTRGGSGGGALAVFPLRPLFVMQAMMTPQAINPKPTRIHIVTIMSAPLHLRYAGIVADCQDITLLQIKSSYRFIGVAGRCSGALVLE